MTSLPLYYYPTKLLFVDDDKLLLCSMQEIFSNTCYRLLSFDSSIDCIKFLSHYSTPIQHKKLLQSLESDGNYGSAKHSHVDFDLAILYQISTNLQRYHEISVMVVDYNMPEINGFELVRACQDNHIQKILLTGKAAEKEAVDGFNSNLINRYIQKGNEDTEQKLVSYVQELTLNYFQRLSSPLLLHLEASSKLPQSDFIFIEFFKLLISRRNISEYYLIDKNGSYLCIDTHGNRLNLVIHTDHSINEWLNLNEEEDGLTDMQLSDIKSRKIIPFFGMDKEAWQVSSSEWGRYFHVANQLVGGYETYYWAIVEEKNI
jgi:CheY-like chemotaxis protein